MSTKPNSITPDKIQYHAEIFGNRLRNRFAHLAKKFRKQHIDCFRLYDWDIKEIRAVVDWYAGHMVIGEYVRWQTGEDWLPAMAQAAAVALNIPLNRVHMKRRQTNTPEGPRYQKLSAKGDRFTVRERDLSFWVNLDDYLDTGLYSDHRDTRVLIKNLAAGKDFLNLFAYTGAFTCAAAAGGAKSTVTVDRSETYLAWAEDNLQLNRLSGPQHELVKSDVPKFLVRAAAEGRKFNLAIVDPPSFFKDQRDQIEFDIKESHPQLLKSVLRLMTPGGLLYFSTNHQRFEPNLGGLPVKDLTEITPKSIPEDYRNRRVHRCWRMVAV